jgi:uncharacterized protein (TIGR03437 family)
MKSASPSHSKTTQRSIFECSRALRGWPILTIGSLLLCSLAALGQTVSTAISFSCSGSGAQDSETGTCSVSPYGSMTLGLVASPQGSQSVTITFSFSNGASSFSAIASDQPATEGPNSASASGTAIINGGTGTLAGASGSFTFSLSGTGTFDDQMITVSGSGTIVTPAPACALQVSPGSLAFSAFAAGNSAPPQTIAIVTSCATPVNFAVTVDSGTAGSAAPPWINVGPSAGATPASLSVSASPGTMPAGTYSAAIHIAIPGSTAQPTTVQVTFTITNASPQLQVSGSLNFSARVQTPSVQTQVVVLRNSGGGGTLSYTASIADGSPWVSVSPASGQTTSNSPVLLQVTVNSQGLANGTFHDILQITWGGGVVSIPISLFVAPQGAVLSVGVSGLLFEARQGNGTGQTQTVSVLNLGDPTSAINWTATVVSGADWAILSNASGTSTPGAPASFTVSVGGDASTLPPGGAYALIKISDNNTASPAVNSPQYVSAVLSIEPAANLAEPQPTPAGVYLFSAPTTLANSLLSENVTIYTSSSTPAMFQTSASTTDGAKWLTVTPPSGTTSTQAPGTISISVSPAGLANGIYSGSVNVSENGQLRSVNVTFLVVGQGGSLLAPQTTVAPRTAAISEVAPRTSLCTPSHIALVQTALSSNFQVPAGWPASLIVELYDDCGNPVSNGSVVASFSNGDPPVTLPGDQHSNIYSATWQPSTVIPSMTVTLSAASGTLQPATEHLSGAVESNSAPAPTLIPGGTLHIFYSVATADALGNGLAPGNVTQVYGTGMASTAQAPGVVPLLDTFSGTFMLIGGIEVPLFYVSPGQLDIQVPFELTPNRQYTAIVSANGALSLPETLNIVPAQPGMAANVDGSVIAQHAADYSLVTASHPAQPGEPLIIYLAGMGATNPAVASGTATPIQLVPASVQPTVSVDGQPTAIAYAGLTPGGVGLYQINFTVPSNARSGSLTLVVMQGGVSSNTTTLPVSN